MHNWKYGLIFKAEIAGKTRSVSDAPSSREHDAE